MTAMGWGVRKVNMGRGPILRNLKNGSHSSGTKVALQDCLLGQQWQWRKSKDKMPLTLSTKSGVKLCQPNFPEPHIPHPSNGDPIVPSQAPQRKAMNIQ